MSTFWLQIWLVLLSLAPWLFLGAAAAGLMHVLLPRDFIHRHFGRPGLASTLKAVAIGVPLPLCSCAVIPAAIGLKKEGASDGAGTAFLIATPQTGIDSILVSAVFLGWPFALFKVAAAFVTGIVGGVIADTGPATAPAAVEAPASTAPHGRPRRPAKAFFSFVFGDLLHMIWPWITIGILVSAAISTWIPSEGLSEYAWLSGPWALLAALVVSVPFYVCATGSVPIAAALVVAGLSPGAALVFLMAGPATNVATIGAVGRSFGRRVLVVYLTVIIVGSLLCGWLFDTLLSISTMTAGAETGHAGHGASPIANACAMLLLLLVGYYAVTDLKRFLIGRAAAAPGADAGAPVLSLTVTGLTCGACVRKLTSALLAVNGVTHATVDLDTGLATVSGKTAESAVKTAIRDTGYDVPD